MGLNSVDLLQSLVSVTYVIPMLLYQTQRQSSLRTAEPASVVPKRFVFCQAENESPKPYLNISWVLT